MSECWYMTEEVADRREENRLSPNAPGSYEVLGEAGVYYRHYDPKDVSSDVEGFIKPLLKQLNYHSFDVVQLDPEALGAEKFEALATQHFDEHLHEDDEARLILDGQGYFDVRDANDRWIRLLSKPGDLLVLPAGLYHRFTTDQNKYVKTLRIFKEAPRWVALNRGPEAEETQARKDYVARLSAPVQTAAGPVNGQTIFSLPYPLEMDAELTTITRRLLEQHSKLPFAVLIFLTGTVDPTTGASWCPYCIPAKLHVADRFAELRTKYGEDRAILVQLPVERAGYIGNPNFLYRLHPTLKVVGVPTMLVLTPAKDAKEKGDVPWYELLEVKLYTREAGTADVLSIE
ncbi:1,2-Dihydroxy-3-keto-5-methylthiopentene dioxygenase [Novymonas esmeraldas]|uniref:Acireductone dioxygenase n=1 Tax=Novymonas esmeraldas TaxID=1808958 RepID=A0AAW0ESC9_9TRYP